MVDLTHYLATLTGGDVRRHSFGSYLCGCHWIASTSIVSDSELLACVLSSSLRWHSVQPSLLNPPLTSMLQLNHPSLKQESLQILDHRVPRPQVLRYVVHNRESDHIMYIDITLKPGVVVAGSSTANPNYFYTWVRDSSLVFKFLINQ